MDGPIGAHLIDVIDGIDEHGLDVDAAAKQEGLGLVLEIRATFNAAGPRIFRRQDILLERLGINAGRDLDRIALPFEPLDKPLKHLRPRPCLPCIARIEADRRTGPPEAAGIGGQFLKAIGAQGERCLPRLNLPVEIPFEETDADGRGIGQRGPPTNAVEARHVRIVGIGRAQGYARACHRVERFKFSEDNHVRTVSAPLKGHRRSWTRHRLGQ